MATWLIVGASRGLGYEFLKQLSANPANTVLGTARTPSNVEKQLAIDGLPQVHIYAADLDKHQTLTSAAKKIAGDHQSVDHLIINGGYVSATSGHLGPTAFRGQEELWEDDVKQSILTNAIGPLNAINAFLPLIRVGKVKNIVAISTGLGDLDFAAASGVAGSVPYSVSKAALNMIISKFAVELKPEGISLLSISPGLVDTEKDKGYLDAITQAFKTYEPKFRGPITPEQSVRAMLKVVEKMSVEQSGALVSHLVNNPRRWLSADGIGDEVEASG